MKNKEAIITLTYGIVSSVTVLVMLTTSFELFDKKYLPSFMLAQKYAVPLIISAMAAVFIVFFEPERLQQSRTITVMRILMLLTLAIFSYFLSTLDYSSASFVTLVVYGIQWIATVVETLFFFSLRNNKAA